jgi:hypothetical protein
LWPIHRRNPIRRVIIATYQAASGAGAAAMAELRDATRAALDGRPYPPRVLPRPYAFNLFSHDKPIDPATDYNDEETKVINEAQDLRRRSCASPRPASQCRCCAPMPQEKSSSSTQPMRRSRISPARQVAEAKARSSMSLPSRSCKVAP